MLSGLCDVCRAPGAMHSCMLCGRVVCGRHYHQATGACTMHAGPGEGGGPPAHGRS